MDREELTKIANQVIEDLAIETRVEGVSQGPGGEWCLEFSAGYERLCDSFAGGAATAAEKIKEYLKKKLEGPGHS